nr:MAG TPA: DNA ligase [Caudoviricetes sp.]
MSMYKPISLDKEQQRLDDIELMQELIYFINCLNDSYFNGGENVVSDREFDKFVDALAWLEKETGITYSSSPTRTVGSKVVSDLRKVTHTHKLLSLAKTTGLDEFVAYFNQHEFVLMPKLDGITCALTYEHGVLKRAETRGDGTVGEDITHNAKEFTNIPLTIPYQGKLYVDGEAVISYEDFEKIKNAENTCYKNPRNLVSGTVRQLDSAVLRRRNVSFIAWRNSTPEFQDEDFRDAMQMLSDIGFTTARIVPVPSSGKGGANVKEFVSRTMETMKRTPYPIDGVVGTFCDQKYGRSLGETSHHPNHSFAFKFYQERNLTTLRNIEWNTTRIGTINPVAVFDPVEIDGTTVSRASLSNVSQIKKLKLGIGDEIEVIKANQIIPMVVRNLTQSDTYSIPAHCPVCGGAARVISSNEAQRLECSNDNCPAVLVDRISNFVSRQGMNIDGLSTERIKLFVNNGWLKNLADVYRLDRYCDDMKQLDGFGDASVDKLLAAIEKSKTCAAENFIVAIGIPGVGKSAAPVVAGAVSETMGERSFIETLCSMADTEMDWSGLNGIGVKTSDGINAYIKRHSTEIALLNGYLAITVREGKESTGMTVCVTGKLKTFKSRKEFEKAAKDAGWSVSSSVTKDTTFLVCNDPQSGSSKVKKAVSMEIPILSEEGFLNNYIRR